ncbi:hypothetical protein HBI56_224020 [Parastagonospora nodorum]|nr:hypothetical protein HBH53_134420 [Parastagonospora nodorum]KAH3985393.1 hypothetical protein HBH51_024390 [Parastagonospora nodorum]KAH4053876.1 hypothetical protein HBH49_072820 [Parastagonospora nodorum]KAH4216212.1 hypothetical protein HBI06_235520 [Parastagonospora nodorum]KAH4226426.1 hypothetical protein HBI05_221700 [Parastagonospora nodorum]
MVGHAFKYLHCPRIPPSIYVKVKSQTTAALRTIFAHVVVSTEMPAKEDFGDIDFLVSSALHFPHSNNAKNFDWEGCVSRIKSTLNTSHGRRGFKNPGCMYFAIRVPDTEDYYWVQVDVKVCFKPDMFEWETFELNYASNSKMIGSMVKPLGLTIDPKGLHVRVDEIEATNFLGSMVWVSKDPRDVLRITGLDRRIVDAGFKTKEEIYGYFTGSWLFNPAHFAARLGEEQYFCRLEDRSPHWTYFIKEWVPKHYPGYCFGQDEPIRSVSCEYNESQVSLELHEWYKRTRACVREKVFIMFPHIPSGYYTKRAAHVKEQEEHRLRAIIMAALPVGEIGWKDEFHKPQIKIKQPEPVEPRTSEFKPTAAGELTPSLTPIEDVRNKELHLSDFVLPVSTSLPPSPWNVPLFLDPLPRDPPILCMPHLPPANMSPEAKLLCLARWTLFDPIHGAPYLISLPRDKDFQMNWAGAKYLGVSDQILVE